MPVSATVASDRSHVAAYEHHPDSSAVVPVDEFSDMQSLSADNDWKSCASALNDVLDDLSGLPMKTKLPMISWRLYHVALTRAQLRARMKS